LVRKARALIALGALTAALAAAEPVRAGCSVLSRHPCFPTVCGVFTRHPCIPYGEYWIGQDLRLTIESAAAGERPASAGVEADASDGRKLDSPAPDDDKILRQRPGKLERAVDDACERFGESAGDIIDIRGQPGG
jgi:hypothetical protein